MNCNPLFFANPIIYAQIHSVQIHLFSGKYLIPPCPDHPFAKALVKSRSPLVQIILYRYSPYPHYHFKGQPSYPDHYYSSVHIAHLIFFCVARSPTSIYSLYSSIVKVTPRHWCIAGVEIKNTDFQHFNVNVKSSYCETFMLLEKIKKFAHFKVWFTCQCPFWGYFLAK